MNWLKYLCFHYLIDWLPADCRVIEHFCRNLWQLIFAILKSLKNNCVVFSFTSVTVLRSIAVAERAGLYLFHFGEMLLCKTYFVCKTSLSNFKFRFFHSSFTVYFIQVLRYLFELFVVFLFLKSQLNSIYHISSEEI